MESKQPLHDLGFKRRPTKKKKSRKGAGKEQPVRPPTSTTLEGLLNRYQNMNRHLPADAPPDTGVGCSGQTDMIEKGEDGFESYLSGKWRIGYPEVAE